MKKILSVVLATVIMFTTFNITLSTYAYEVLEQNSKVSNELLLSGSDFTVGDYEYNIYDEEKKEVCINKYNGTEKNLEIPAEVNGYTVVIINEKAFFSKDYESVVIPDSVREIKASAFSLSTHVKTITLSTNLKSIGKQAFSHDYMLESITIPASVEEIGEEAFWGCYSLETAVFSDGMKAALPRWMFLDCENLETVILSDSIQILGESVFLECHSLENITLPDSITEIGTSCFDECSSLKKINIPPKVESIGRNAFLQCTSLETIEFSEGIKIIGPSAFSRCISLKSVTIPDSVTSLDTRAFGDCDNLESIVLGKNVEFIGESAFTGCCLVENDLVFPESIKTISSNAFLNCKRIMRMYFPDKDISIDSTAFQGCEPYDKYLYNSEGSWCVEKNVKDIVYNGNELDFFKDRTRQSVTEEYRKAYSYIGTFDNNDSSTWYEIPASLTAPYNHGKLTQDTLDSISQTVNFYRWLTGANYLKNACVHSDSLQAQALDRCFATGHYISNDAKPDDMSDEMWAEGFECTHTILAYSFTPFDAIMAWLNEGGEIGHRMAIISPTLSNIQFGICGTATVGDCVSDDNDFIEPFTAFPAPGPMPNCVLRSGLSWNIVLDYSRVTYKDLSDLIIKVTNLNTGYSYQCMSSNNSLWISFGGIAFAAPNDIDTETDFYTDTYRVEVTGLHDTNTFENVSITYDVDFYDPREYMDLNLIDQFFDMGSLLFEFEPDDSMLEYMTQYLPKENTKLIFDEYIGNQDDMIISIPLTGSWTLDKDNMCYRNTVDKSVLTEYQKDPDNILDNIKLNYVTVDSDYYMKDLYEHHEGNYYTAGIYEEGEKFELSVPNHYFDFDDFYILKITEKDGKNEYEIIYKRSEDNTDYDTENNERIKVYSKEKIEKSDEGDYALIGFNGTYYGLRYCGIFVTAPVHFTVNHKGGEGTVIREATCKQDGVIQYTCEVCGETYTEIIPKPYFHDTVIDYEVDPTCTEDGLTNGTHCSVCGEVITPQEVIPSLGGHTIEKIDAIEPTCTEDGYTEGSYCSVCGITIDEPEIIPAKGHNIVTTESDHSCENDYVYKEYCENCGEVFTDVFVPALGHDWEIIPGKPATCTEAGYSDSAQCSVCGELKEREYLQPNGHTVVIDNGIEPTCTTDGLTEGKHCSVCGEIIIPQETVLALGHIFVDGQCTRCGKNEDSDNNTSSDTNISTDKNTNTDIDIVTDTDSDSDTNSNDANTDTDTDSDDGTYIGTDINSDIDTHTDTNTTNSDIDTHTDTDTNTNSDIDTHTDTDTNSNIDTHTDTDTNSDDVSDKNKKEANDPKKETSDPERVDIILGDIDGDGKISAKDSLYVQRFVIKLKLLDEVQQKAADVNNDSKITAKDALDILRYTIHMSKNNRIGKNISIV